MDRVFHGLITLLLKSLEPRHNVQVLFLMAQIRILRSRIKSERIMLQPEERLELLRLGKLLDHQVQELLHVVKPETYRCWLRERERGREYKFIGRPPIVEEVRALVLRFAGENVRWGYKRIVGELKKLGHYISVSTVKDIMKDAELPPTPLKGGRKCPITWKEFIHANMDSLISCDFFTKPVHSLYGSTEAYVLVFIHLGSRKVYASSATYHPNEDWVQQQARNVSMWLEDEGLEARYLIHDRDTKFSLRFREFWKSEGVKCIRTAIMAPKMNAYAETFIGKIKRECLDYFFCLSLGQLDYVVRTWVGHYNTLRPHQGKDMGNSVLDWGYKPQVEGSVKCREKLGGVIREYYREAA